MDCLLYTNLKEDIFKHYKECFPNCKLIETTLTLIEEVMIFFYLYSIFVFLLFLIGWKDIDSRRLFFENYAKKEGFDPLIPDNWYIQPRTKIADSKVQ